MKKVYLCTLLMFVLNVLNAQVDNDCDGYVSDDMCLRYTASGYQDIVNGNHSKAINESRKIANVVAESELAKMINSMVTSVMIQMSEKASEYSDMYVDTLLVSSYKIFKGMKTVCQSATKLNGNMYVTYVTKEISLDKICDMFYLVDDEDRHKLKDLFILNKNKNNN